jgi:hypothetical protein
VAHTVYLETSIISYLTAQPSRDLVTAARQKLTREWWRRRRAAFEVYVSEAVIAEAPAGDSEAATRRLSVLANVPLLDVTPAARALRTLLPARFSFRSMRLRIRFMLRWPQRTASSSC